MTTGGSPVSDCLEAELRDSVRRHGIVVWLDADNHYSTFVDRLGEQRKTGELPYEVHSFRGSFLETMFALEHLAGSVDRESVVIHLPGFNEESVKDTPLLELYLAGTRFRKSLPTLLKEAASGHVRPDAIESFLEQGTLQLETADRWLSDHLSGESDGLAAHLRNLRPIAAMEELLSKGRARDEAASPAGQAALVGYFATKLGIPESFSSEMLSPDSSSAADIAFLVAGWAMCVEYVDDLRRPPLDSRLNAAKSLPRPVIDAGRAVADHLRVSHAEFYRRTAQEIEEWMPAEVAAARAEDLGKIDTFRFEETKVLEAATAALDQHAWTLAGDWSKARVNADSIWLRDDPSRRAAWQLIGDAATLGGAIQQASPPPAGSANPESLVSQYETHAYRVDQFHRRLEQRRQAQLFPTVPDFEILRERLDSVRRLWREWADGWARVFNQACRQHGYMPEPARQQRCIFDDVVRPAIDDTGLTVLFLVDALRFEMAQELLQLLGEMPATTVHLNARLAELPTVTEVGMNVLAPVVQRGRLRPDFVQESIKGFATGQFRVFDADTRKRAMHDRAGGGTCPWFTLREVLEKDSTSLKKSLTRARLAVVHSREIDEAGEAGQGLSVFADVLQRLRAAWRILRDVGAQRFIITADHGFLLHDDSAEPPIPFGRRSDPNPRYVLSTVPEQGQGKVCVALSDLAYDAPALHLVMPETTTVFDTGARRKSFVHGGNSLQERVIPVLTLVHRRVAGSSALAYVMTAQAARGLGDLHCVTGQVSVGGQRGLGFGGPAELELSMQVVDTVDARVEVVDARGAARVESGAVVAAVGQPFEVFFRLSGSTGDRVQVQFRLAGADADLPPCVVDDRFQVRVVRQPDLVATPATASPERDWLEALPAGGVRSVFDHLATHGVITEDEAARMLGSPRAARQFALKFEEYARKSPFAVRIDVVAGVKRFVREGSSR